MPKVKRGIVARFWSNLRAPGSTNHLQDLRLGVLLVGAHDVMLGGLDDDEVRWQVDAHGERACRH